MSFRQIRRLAQDGEAEALRRLKTHVAKRIRKGWGVGTVAERLGISIDAVLALAPGALQRDVDPRPRLRKRSHE